MSVRTIYELAVFMQVGPCLFAEPARRFDELEQGQAIEAFNREGARAKAVVGQDRTVHTHGGNEFTGRTEAVVVELWQSKTDGESWTGSRKIVGSDGERKDDGMRVFVVAEPIALKQKAREDETDSGEGTQ